MASRRCGDQSTSRPLSERDGWCSSAHHRASCSRRSSIWHDCSISLIFDSLTDASSRRKFPALLSLLTAKSRDWLHISRSRSSSYTSRPRSGEREGPIAKQWEGEGHPCYLYSPPYRQLSYFLSS